MLGLNKDYMIVLGQTNLISGSTDFFQNLKGRSVGKKRKIKKKSPIFCIGFDYQQKLSLGQTLHSCSNFSKFCIYKVCQYVEINVTLKQKYICAIFIKHFYFCRKETAAIFLCNQMT